MKYNLHYGGVLTQSLRFENHKFVIIYVYMSVV